MIGFASHTEILSMHAVLVHNYYAQHFFSTPRSACMHTNFEDVNVHLNTWLHNNYPFGMQSWGGGGGGGGGIACIIL